MKRQVFLKVQWNTDRVTVQPGSLSTIVLGIVHALRAFTQDLNPYSVAKGHSVNLTNPPGGSYATSKNPGPFFFGSVSNPKELIAFRALNSTVAISIQGKTDGIPQGDLRNPGLDFISLLAPAPIAEFQSVAWAPSVKLPLVATEPNNLKGVQHETVIIGDQTSQNFLRPVSTVFLEKAGLNTKLVCKWNNPKTDTPISIFACGFGNPANLLLPAFFETASAAFDMVFKGEICITLDVDTDQYTRDDLYFVALVPENMLYDIECYSLTPMIGQTGAPVNKFGSFIDFRTFTQSAIPLSIPANSPSAATLAATLATRVNVRLTDLGGVVPNYAIPLYANCVAGSSPLSSYDTSFIA